MKGIVRTIILAVLSALLIASCSLDMSSDGFADGEILMPVFASPASGASRAIDATSPDTGSSVAKIYLYQAPALMGFREDADIADGSSTVMVYGNPVEVTATQDGSDIVYTGTSTDLLFTIRLHADGSLDYRQSADLFITNGGDDRSQTIEYINVTEGIDMKVGAEGNVRGSFRSWFAMEFKDGSGAGATAMYGEVRSKGDIYAMVNLTMDSSATPFESLPSLEEAFEYDLDEKLEDSADIEAYHPYQIGWLKNSVYDSYEYDKEMAGGYNPDNREKCEKLNQKIVALFGDDSWQVEYLGENPGHDDTPGGDENHDQTVPAFIETYPIDGTISDPTILLAPALTGFTKSSGESSSTTVYGIPVALTVTNQDGNTIFKGSSENMLFAVTRHSNGHLDYRQAYMLSQDGLDFVSVVEGVDMVVDGNGNISGGYKSWGWVDTSSQIFEIASQGEVRSEEDIYAIANLMMKMGPSGESRPALEDAFGFDIDDRIANVLPGELVHYYCLNWFDDTILNSYMPDGQYDDTSISPSSERKCEQLNGKISEIFNDEIWQIDYVEMEQEQALLH